MTKEITLPVLLAFVLWTLMFSPWTSVYIPFWIGMSVSALILIGLSLYLGGKPQLSIKPIDLVVGIGLAVVLWGVFWVGDKVSQWLFPSFARMQVDSIYDMKSGWSPWVLSALLLLIIGPAEELFWRGYIQRRLSEKVQPWMAYVITVGIYTLVHLFSFNFMLIMAAMVCGLIWGLMYYLMPQRLGAIVLSHALWDAAVFIWFPIL